MKEDLFSDENLLKTWKELEVSSRTKVNLLLTVGHKLFVISLFIPNLWPWKIIDTVIYLSVYFIWIISVYIIFSSRNELKKGLGKPFNIICIVIETIYLFLHFVIGIIYLRLWQIGI
ncbi:MAG: hypothetical protein FWG99_03425 [Treponema sp.]|nr:hypothetical protein [Treponema sp.]